MDRELERKKQYRKRKKKIKRLKKRLLQIGVIIFLVLIILLAALLIKSLWEKTQQPAAKEVLAPIESPVEIPEITYASVLTAGDIIMHEPFLTSDLYCKEDGSYDYTSIFSYIEEDYGDADFTVVNLESTISDGNYSGYPRFRSPAAIASALSQSNVDMCLLANNHIYDNYDEGLTLTMNALKSNSLLYTGARKSASDKMYFIQEINGIKVGFFNYVFDTGAAGGQTVSINSIPVSDASVQLINTFNYGNLDKLYSEIETGLSEMQDAGVAYTIAYIHWGNEYQTEENATQRSIAQSLCDLGIDALIGGHPHVIQPVDLLTASEGDHQMVCVYSMGNHLSNQYKERMDSMPTGHTEDGLMVKLTLRKINEETVELVQTDFIPTWVYHASTNVGSEYYILPLDDTEQILQDASDLNIAQDVVESLERTNAIIGEGVEKVQSALPLS